MRERDAGQILPEIRRSITRMQGSERAQYALALGHELAQLDDLLIAEPTMEAPELIAIVEADRERAIDRFATFLERNPRVIRTLDPESIRAILLPVIKSREADVQGTDVPDDAPYSHELATALQSLVPAISFKRVQRTATAPFVAGGRGAASIARFAFSVPRRLWTAFIRFATSLGNATIALARILGRAVAAPFIALYKLVVLALAAIGRGVTALGNGTIALAAAIADAIVAAVRFVLDGIGNGARSGARGTVSATRFAGNGAMATGRATGNAFMAAARATGNAFTAAARAIGNALMAAGRSIGSAFMAAARFVGNAFTAAARFAGIAFTALGRSIVKAAGAFARVASRVPSAVWKGIVIGAFAVLRPLAALGSAAATVPGRLASTTRRTMAGPVASAGHKTAALSKNVVVAAGGAALAAGHSTANAAKKSFPWAQIAATPLAVVTSGVLAAVLFAAIVLPFARTWHFGTPSAPVAAATAPTVARAKVPHHRSRGRVALKPHPKQIARAKIHRVQPRPVRVASAPRKAPRAKGNVNHVAWKFDPAANPFTSKNRIVARVERPRKARVSQIATARVEPQLVQRARLIVTSYLASLMRGDASTALGHLGLSANAPISNLSEGPVLQRAAGFRIVHAALRNGGTAKIDVEITGPQGRYFGVYTVQANGPAAWITDHTVIPTTAAVAVHR